MSSIPEIEQAIVRFPTPQVDELAQWLEAHRARRATALPVEEWLNRARGAVRPDATTADVMSLTRGDE